MPGMLRSTASFFILISNVVNLISLYVLHTHGDTLIVVVYVDDLIITDNNIDLILRLKK
jgi:hypothetical protein